MKRILVLGAGKSSPYLISYLLDQAEKHDWFVVIADMDLDLAQSRLGVSSRGEAIRFDINNSKARSAQIGQSDVVVNMLAPRFQYVVASACVRFGKHMISVSYEDRLMRDLAKDAERRGVLMLTEIGLDPGIDHMSATELIQRIRNAGGIIKSFESYGGGLPAPDTLSNTMKYVISWNPRNVVMAGENGAQFMEKGQIKILPYHNVFKSTWPLEVPGIGMMEVYPNRDSLAYRERYGFDDADTVIRGTIRYPGWCEAWYQIQQLGLPNEKMIIPGLKDRTFAELTEMFLPLNIGSQTTIDKRVARFLNINPTGEIIEKMRWLGLFSEDKIQFDVETAAGVMTHLLSDKLRLTPDARDMVILMHKIIAEYPDENNRQEEITSTMLHYGEKAGFTSMAKSVGLPAALVAHLLLTEELALSGCHIPTHPKIYEPLMEKLAAEGFSFSEQVKQL